MHDLRSFAIRPFSVDELHRMRQLARSDRSFDVLAGHACRLGYLSAHLSGRLDAEAALGLCLAAAEAHLALARLPAANAVQRRTKAALFGSWPDAEADGTNLAAILKAALDADAARIAPLRAPSRAGRGRS